MLILSCCNAKKSLHFIRVGCQWACEVSKGLILSVVPQSDLRTAISLQLGRPGYFKLGANSTCEPGSTALALLRTVLWAIGALVKPVTSLPEGLGQEGVSSEGARQPM